MKQTPIAPGTWSHATGSTEERIGTKLGVEITSSRLGCSSLSFLSFLSPFLSLTLPHSTSPFAVDFASGETSPPSAMSPPSDTRLTHYPASLLRFFDTLESQGIKAIEWGTGLNRAQGSPDVIVVRPRIISPRNS